MKNYFPRGSIIIFLKQRTSENLSQQHLSGFNGFNVSEILWVRCADRNKMAHKNRREFVLCPDRHIE